jgi:hypothetical protein
VGGPEIGWCKTTDMENMMAGRNPDKPKRRVAKPKRRVDDVSLFGAVAISGAAFGSAMGRQSRGTLDALLALANARLGVWLPNPRYVAHDCRWYGRRHLGYLAREVFGRYSPDAPWILVSDGGHYENLGLVELFRRRCTRILCFDASGASGGAPTTVAEALRLAEEELGVAVVDVGDPWTSLPGQAEPPFQAKRLCDALSGRLAREPVVVGRFTYPPESGVPDDDEHRQGWLVIGRAVLTPATPWPILSYAAGNPEFPNDGTADQWFDHEQFANYRLLGRHVAERMLESIGEEAGWWSGDGGDAVAIVPREGEPGPRHEDASEDPHRRTDEADDDEAA